jgi:hypothetical protein
MRAFLHPRTGAVQTDEDQSFVGGIPRVPAGIPAPTCLLCGAELTFYFQVAFSVPHPWKGYSLAVFACTTTADDDSDGEGDDRHLIPKMPDDAGKGADVSRDFLEAYQQAFRFLVFETARGEPMRGYAERVAFAPLDTSGTRQRAIGLLNDKPQWRSEDESPAALAGSRPVFLLELFGDVLFPTVEGSPPQMVPGLDGKPAPSVYGGRYHLFVSNYIYLFGPAKPDSAVYAFTQR